MMLNSFFVLRDRSENLRVDGPTRRTCDTLAFLRQTRFTCVFFIDFTYGEEVYDVFTRIEEDALVAFTCCLRLHLFVEVLAFMKTTLRGRPHSRVCVVMLQEEAE